MKDVLLSIVIPTLNRSRYVIQCLDEVVKQAQPYSDVEVIVVDNGSTDDTAEKVQEFIRENRSSGVDCFYLFEPVKGSNRTRNRGCDLARGRAIALLDDDAAPLANWVGAYRQHFLDGRSHCVAGRVEIRPENPMPQWFPESMQWALGKTEFGNSSRMLKAGEYAQSNNCAFTREVYEMLGGFDPESLIYGDETEFFRRAGQNGFTTEYRQDIVVDHCVPPERLTREGLYNKARLWGRGSAYCWNLESPDAPRRLLRIAEYAARTLYVGARWCVSPTFGRAYTFNFNRGHLKQLCVQAGGRKNSSNVVGDVVSAAAAPRNRS